MEHVIKAVRESELVDKRKIISYARFGALHANQFITFMNVFSVFLIFCLSPLKWFEVRGFAGDV